MTYFFLCIFIVLVLWRPQEWLFTWLYGWPLLDVFAVMAVGAFFIEYKQGTLKIPQKMPQTYLIIGLWFASMMSSVPITYFENIWIAFQEFGKFALITFMLLCALDRPSRLRGVAFLFVAMSCVMVVHALMQYRLGYGFAGLPPYVARVTEDGSVTRMRSRFFGIFVDPNDLAQMLVTCVPLTFALFRRRSFLGFILAAGISALLIYTAVVVCGSRGALIGVVAECAIILILVLPDRWLPSLTGAGIAAALILCPIASRFYDPTGFERVIIWGEANQVFKEHFLFGVGYRLSSEHIFEFHAAHNAYIQAYVETGVFGYWFWFGLLYSGFIGAWRTRMALGKPKNAEASYIKYFAGLSVASMAAYAATSYFLTRAWIFITFFMVAILGALPYVAKKYLPADHPPLIEFKKDMLIRNSIYMLGSIIYIYVTIRLLNLAWGG